MPDSAVHPEMQELAGFLAGRLPTLRQQAVERHIAECAACCRTLEALPEDTLVGRLRDGGEPTFGASFPGFNVRSLAETPVPAELREHARYRILQPLGAGGMGIVYLAEHRVMERRVALKVIHPALLNNRNAVARFRSEVKAAASLSHPGIVRAFDAEQSGDTHFLVMEYVEGVSFAKLIAEHGPLPYPHACNYVRQVALGLQHALEAGMVHRDIKPQNLILTPAGQVKILDFGLAKFAREESQQQGITPATSLKHSGSLFTHVGAVLGTPDYIAPEQTLGAGDVDIRADIYSLGCTLYFLLVGEAPYPLGSIDEKLAAHRHAPLPSLARLRLPQGLANLLARMMAKRPEDRPSTPSVLAQMLLPFVQYPAAPNVIPNAAQGETLPTATPIIIARSTAPGGRRQSRSQISKSMRAAFGAAVIAACGVFGNMMRNHSTPADDAQAERPLGAAAATTLATPQIAPLAATPLPRRTRTVLFVVAPQYTYDDYQTVRDLLERKAGMTVRVASTGVCRPIDDAQHAPVTPDILLSGPPIQATDFDALYFPGGHVQLYKDNTPERDVVWRLIDDMLGAGKPVAALGWGQAVLAFKGDLRNKRVATNDFIARLMPNDSGIPAASPVEVDGLVVTGRSADVAEQFTLRLVQTIQTAGADAKGR